MNNMRVEMNLFAVESNGTLTDHTSLFEYADAIKAARYACPCQTSDKSMEQILMQVGTKDTN